MKAFYLNKSYICRLFAIALSFFLLAPTSTILAQTTAVDKETPSLVVPAEEASEAVAAPGQSPPSLSVPADESSSGSLYGAFLSSYVAHSEGNLIEALRYLKDAQRKDPSNKQIASQVMILDITLGNIDEAAAIARQLEDGEKHELIVDLLLAIESVKQNKLANAHKRLSSASSESFKHIWGPLLLAWMQDDSAEKKPVSVSDVLQDSKTIPTFVHYHVAILNDVNGFMQEAEEHYQKATADVARAPFRALLAYINLKARQNKPEEIQQMLIELQQERPDMEELLRQELPYLNNLAGDGTLPTERFIQNSRQGIAEVLLTMASMLYTLDISQDIPLYLQMAIYLREDFPTAKLMLGNYFESLELWDEAGAEYSDIRESSPLYLKSMIRYTNVLETQGKEEEASKLAKRVVNEFPNSIDAWMSMGDLHRRRGEFGTAADDYSQAIKLLNNKFEKKDWVLFFARGASYEREGKRIEAERDLRQARNLSGNQPEVLNYIGYMWLEDGKKIFEAVKLIEKAHKLSPNEPHIVDSLGWAYFKTGRLQEAIALLEFAAEKIPNDTTINEHLGDAYWHANRILEARYQWKRALDFAEEGTQADELKRKIQEGLSTYSFHTPPITTPATLDVKLPKKPSDTKEAPKAKQQ